ncbi:hypothetical protein DERF_006945 [Dermatophagoides farinae]|uniref:Uncharacterized protein n=1 Tax=Dermatophagoides farinae TaxID=6954 RepID=A0A922L408_DERFA|nr:hypothetical protein DERF_006945 [Dermatophagoides farinae]
MNTLSDGDDGGAGYDFDGLDELYFHFRCVNEIRNEFDGGAKAAAAATAAACAAGALLLLLLLSCSCWRSNIEDLVLTTACCCVFEPLSAVVDTSPLVIVVATPTVCVDLRLSEFIN